MSLVEWLMLATLGVSISSTIILPFVLRTLNRQDVDRANLRREFHERTNHLDACLDALRNRVVGEACTRGDMAALEARLEGTLNRMRAAISGDTHGLHERIFRIENHHFNAAPGDD